MKRILIISLICFLIERFLWIIPIPPAFDIAIAILDSVTVSIAEDNRGTFKFKFFDSLQFVIASTGSTEEY